jgi:sulfite oxidase
MLLLKTMIVGRRRLLGFLAFAGAMGPRRLLADGAAAAKAPEDGAHLLRYGGAPQNLATPTAYFDRLITPTNVFFVRSHHGPPLLDRARKLSVDGLVKNQLSLNVEELRKQFPEVTVTAVLQCAGNGRALMQPRVPGIQWMHGAMGQAAFTGVRLRDVLEKAGFDKSAGPGQHVRVSGADTPAKPATPDFVRSIPIERALDPSTIIAFKMNGEDLTLAHGAPMRLIVPRWAGDHWVKWLTSVRVQKEEADGFYMQTAYRMPIEPVEPGAAVPPEKMKSASTFPIKSTIGFPVDGARIPPGKQRVVGIAFSGEAPIAGVEVSIDGGKTWNAARLEGPAEAGRWQVFRYEFDQKAAGRIRAMARATDKKGTKQPEKASWNPSGYFWNAWHAVEWEVTA